MTLGKSSGWEQSCRCAAFALPWLSGILHASPAPSWVDDVAVVRTFGLLPVGLEGLVSSALGGLFGLLPLGNKLMRAGWASALVLGLAALLLYLVARRLLEYGGRPSGEPLDSSVRAPPRLVAPLALVAALSVTLGPSFALQGSAPGGAVVGAALALAGIAVLLGVVDLGARFPVVLGALVAATVLESRGAALGLLAAFAVQQAGSRRALSGRDALGLALGAGAVLVLPLLLALSLMASHAPEAALASGLLGHGWALEPGLVEKTAALGVFFREVGPLWWALSLGGLALGLFRRRLRPAMLPIATLVALDAVVGVESLSLTARDPWASLRLLALAALSVAGALAAQTAFVLLDRARIAFARPSSVLLLAYAGTLVFVSVDDAAAAAGARAAGAAEAWTDEALGGLPPRSALLVRSETPFFRLLAARVSAGQRPDLLVVPSALLERGGVRAELVERERDLIPLVRDVLISGRPSEYALSGLADARPTYVEIEPGWDRRLFSHLVPRAFFTELSAHPLGRSDRRLGIEGGEDAFDRVAARVEAAPDRDPATRSVLVAALGQRALLLAALGDQTTAQAVVGELSALEPDAALVRRLEARLTRAEGGRIELSELLAAF